MQYIFYTRMQSLRLTSAGSGNINPSAWSFHGVAIFSTEALATFERYFEYSILEKCNSKSKYELWLRSSVG